MAHIKRLSVFMAMLISIATAALLLNHDVPIQEIQPTSAPITKRSTRPPDGAMPFWEAAVVPDPGERIPAPTVSPENLGIAVPITPVDPAASITKAISENNLPALQSAALAWFEKDPSAARDWLSIQPTLDDLQPAICFIANRIGEQGDVKTAIEWANTLTDPVKRADTLFDIQALALRNGRITIAELSTEELSEDRLLELKSGAAGD